MRYLCIIVILAERMIVMNHWRKMVCTVLAACSLSVVGTAGAVEPSIPSGAAEAQGTEIVPMASHIGLDVSITRKSESWSQNSGYGSYRVWVENTTSQRMTATITSRSASDQHTFYVSANSNKTYTVNNAVSGTHTITFATASGYLSGTVRVRVSEEPL